MLALTTLSTALKLALGLAALPLLGVFKESPRAASPSAEEDHEMVRAALAGDATAYRGLIERYQGRIYLVILGVVHNREDAKELTQDTFVKAYRSLSHFRLEGSFYAWLCRTATNIAIDHVRRRRVRRTEAYDEGVAARDEDGVISLQHRREDPSRALEKKRLRELVLDEIAKLPPEHRLAIVLREIDGLSYREIAEIMDTPEGTVMSRIHYARKKLQAALLEHPELVVADGE